jgi:hypothetical protein
MTNEDVIDLYDRVKMGAIVVVLEPRHGDSPFNFEGGAAGRRQLGHAIAIAFARVLVCDALRSKRVASPLPAGERSKPERSAGFG